MKKIIEEYNIDITQLFEAFQKAVNFNMVCSITDVNGTIIYVNDRFCEICKYLKEELIGQNHRIINSGYHPQDFFRNLWGTITRGEIWRGEVKSQAKDGTYFWLDSIIIPLVNANGKIVQYFSLRMPINEKKELEELNEKRIKNIEKILFQISHQIRQPIVQILAVADLFEEVDLSELELKQCIQHMKEAAQHLDQCTKELTAFVVEEKKKVIR